LKRRRAEEELRCKRREDFARAEQEREERKRKLSQDRQKKAEEAMRRQEAYEAELQKQEMARSRTRDEELKQRRSEYQKLVDTQQERAEEARKRDQAATEEKMSRFEESEKQLQQRIADCRRKREESLLSIRQRNEERLRRSQSAMQKMAKQDLVRRQEYERKSAKTLERLTSLISERQHGSSQKTEADRSRQVRSNELLEQRRMQELQKLAEQDTRVAELRKKAEQESQLRAAEQWLRVRIGEDNARRIERRAEWEWEQTLRKMEDKAAFAQQVSEQRRLEAESTRMRAHNAEVKKRKLAEEFASLMSSGGTPDFQKLAEKFGLDYEALRTAIAEERRLSKPGKSNDATGQS
jgi:hypothetical protein